MIPACGDHAEPGEAVSARAGVNRQRLTDLPALWAYSRRLYALPAFGGTLDFDQVRRHGCGTQRHLNPRGIVPLDPHVDRNL